MKTGDIANPQAFSLEVVMEQRDRKNKIVAFLTDTLFVWMYLAALTAWMVSALQLTVSMGACLMLQGIAALAVVLLFELAGGKEWLKVVLWCAGLLLLAVLLYQLWSSGLHLILNAAENELGKQFPYMLPAYSVTVSKSMQSTAVYLAVEWLALLFALAGYYLVRYGNNILLGLHFVGILLLQSVTGIAPGLFWEAFILICLLGVWIRGHQAKLPAGSQQVAGVQSFVLILIIAGILSLGGNYLTDRFLPESTLLTSWKESLLQSIQNSRYQGKSKVLPDGDFSGLSSFEPGDKTVLEVTMSQPASYYLRGFTGCEYTGTGWKESDGSLLWQNRDLFYWLHQNNLYGQEILGDAATALGTEEDVGEINTIQINNKSGSSRYCYVPYELQSKSETSLRETMDAQKIGDSGLLNSGWKGERTYTYTALTDQVTKYSKYAAALLNTDALSDAGKDYQELEGYYNEFAYSAYLTVPAQIQASLSNILGDINMEEGEKHVDYAEAKQNILYVLTSSYTDQNKLSSDWNGSDFIYDFLEVSKEGYSVHFASAATMMFRYYGIPARYVEGYLITPDDVKAMTADEAYEVDETHAHAWVEYYQDGVGWLPFETTPSYLNTMQQSDDFQDISGISGESPQEENQPDEDDDEEENEEDNYSFDWLRFFIVVMIGAIILLILLMLGCLIWVILQRKKSKKAKALFDSEDRRQAICSLFQYTMNILSVAGLRIRNTSLYRYEKSIGEMFDEETAEQYRKIVEIRQEAVYSQHEITEEQRQQLSAFKDKIWNRVYTNGSRLQKLQLKYIYFL